MSATQPYNIQPISPNDPRPFAGVENGGFIHQPRRIEVRQPLVIAGLKKNQVYEIDLANELAHDYLISGISCDIVDDDGNSLQSGVNNKYLFVYVQFLIQVVDRTTKRPLRTINVYLSSYPNYQNELLLSPENLYHVQVNKDVNDVTFLGVPVVTKQAIKLISPPVVG